MKKKTIEDIKISTKRITLSPRIHSKHRKDIWFGHIWLLDTTFFFDVKTANNLNSTGQIYH